MSQSPPPNASASGGKSSTRDRFVEWLHGSDWDPKRKLLQNIAIRIGSRPAAKWDPKLKRFETQWRLWILLWLVAAITSLVLYWVIAQKVDQAPIRELPAGADLAMVLAPVLAASAGIERFLETIFGIIEGNWKTLVAYLGRGMRWLQSAEAEVDSARDWLAKVSTEYSRELKELPQFQSKAAATASTTPEASSPPAGQPPTTEPLVFTVAKTKLDDAKKLMDLAEDRLRIAEGQLSQVTNSSGYKNAKRAASIYLGLLLGLIVATASSLQMFAMLGVRVGSPKIDVLITGLVIGSGSAPVHSLINILQSAKDTLDSAQGWLEANKGKKEKQPTT